MVRRLAVLMIGLARIAFAQAGPAEATASVQEALTWLRSGDLPTIAWGAWSVASNRLVACTAELQAQLASLAKVDPARRELMVGYLLDALIQVDARVPVDQLRPFFDQRKLRAQLLILLLRSGDEVRVTLRRWFRAEDDPMWSMYGNLLAKARDGEFATAVLSCPVHLKVSAVDQAIPAEGLVDIDEVVLHPARQRAIWSLHTLAAGYPPFASYVVSDLRTDRNPGSFLVGDGPMVLRALREVHPSMMEWLEREAGSNRGRVYGWLAEMLRNRAPDRLLEHDQWVMVQWSGADAFLAAVRERRAEIERDYRALVTACVAAKLVDPAAAKDRLPRIELQFDDRRSDRSVPLPEWK
jgi:hypothetical protein